MFPHHSGNLKVATSTTCNIGTRSSHIKSIFTSRLNGSSSRILNPLPILGRYKTGRSNSFLACSKKVTYISYLGLFFTFFRRLKKLLFELLIKFKCIFCNYVFVNSTLSAVHWRNLCHQLNLSGIIELRHLIYRTSSR